MKRSLVGSACFSALLALTACSSGGGGGKDDGGDPPPAQSRPGMGPSKDKPVGTVYTLPTGVELQKPTKGDDPFCIPVDQKEKDKKGSGGLVRLCLNFRNTNTQVPITVVFPPGLVFISDSDATQNGILIQTTSIEVPAGRTQFFVPLYLYCLNKDRYPTSGGQDTYSMGPVTQDSSMLELTGLLQSKTLPLVESNNTVQEAVWHITDGSGLTASDRDAISKL